MQHPRFSAAVLIQWTRLDDRWQSERWQAIGVTGDEREPPGAPPENRSSCIETIPARVGCIPDMRWRCTATRRRAIT